MDIEALNDISYGMYVISTVYDGRNIGCFVNTVCQITANNPIISISVNKDNYTNEALRSNKRFSVSILSEKTNKEIIGNFGFFSSRDKDKFEKIEYKNVLDVPVVLDNICGYLICEVINVVDSETHDIFIARVIEAKKESDYIPMTYKYYHDVIKGKAPKTAPTYREEKKEDNSGKYVCKICGHIYDENKEGVKFEDLPDTWICPMCGVPKDMFIKMD